MGTNMAGARILVVDDEAAVLMSLSLILRQEGYEVETAQNGEEALEKAGKTFFNVLFTDLLLPDVSGIELMKEILSINPSISSVVVTGQGSVETSVEAMKAGAEDYILKPFRVDEVILIVKRILEKQSLKKENFDLKRSLKKKYKFENMVGNSNAMLDLFKSMEKVADCDTTVLIFGESGTGKELVAKNLHYNSSRASRPLVPVHCGAIPETLLESELFGHEKGAFTGAVACKPGKFELAHGGTIFLDEIGEMSPALQVKLLRVLQEKEFERVGGTKTIKIDVRVLAATNRILEKEVEEKRFREDLYYRLHVIPLRVPPLRERDDDFLLLANYFIEDLNKTKKRNIRGISPEALVAMKNYDWHGNVRELENVIERIIILKGEGIIDLDDLPDVIYKSTKKIQVAKFRLPDAGIDFVNVVNDFENDLILQAMQKASGVKNKAAQLLKLNRTTLVEKIKKKKLDHFFDNKTVN